MIKKYIIENRRDFHFLIDYTQENIVTKICFYLHLKNVLSNTCIYTTFIDIQYIYIYKNICLCVKS